MTAVLATSQAARSSSSTSRHFLNVHTYLVGRLNLGVERLTVRGRFL